MSSLLDKLLGGDLRSIGKADEVIAEILEEPALFYEVFKGIKSSNPLIRMRAADVVEKIAREHPEYLIPCKEELLHEVSEIEQQEVRWHVALLFSYLDLTDTEKSIVVDKLLAWANNSKSKIVRVNSLQALADIGRKDSRYRELAIKTLEQAMTGGSPAVVARAKKLLKQLNKKKLS